MIAGFSISGASPESGKKNNVVVFKVDDDTMHVLKAMAEYAKIPSANILVRTILIDALGDLLGEGKGAGL